MKFKQSGFTIIEMLIVILIVGILSAIVFENIGNQIVNSQIRQATTQVIADLERARNSSLKTSQDAVVTINGSSYTLQLNSSAGGTQRINMPDNTVLSATNSDSSGANVTKITYSAPYGTVNAIGAKLKISAVNRSNVYREFYLLGVTGKVVQ